MSRHEGDIHFCHILDQAKEAVATARGRTRAHLDSDRQLNLSLARLLEIVGEAGRVPAGERARHPDTPWPEIVGLRNRLIHGYDSADFDILWQIVCDDPPQLIAALEKALGAWGIARGRSTREADHRHAR